MNWYKQSQTVLTPAFDKDDVLSAALDDCNLDYVLQLVKSEEKYQNLDTLLGAAVTFNCMEIVKWAISRGASANFDDGAHLEEAFKMIRYESGQSEDNMRKIITFLIENGAKVSQKVDRMGRAAYGENYMASLWPERKTAQIHAMEPAFGLNIPEDELLLIKDNIQTFDDRNRVNEKINSFKNVVSILDKLARGAYQNMPDAIEMLKEIAEDKATSSYPRIRKLFLTAIRVGRDSPTNFSVAVAAARDKLISEVQHMEEKRDDYCRRKLPERMKERFEHAREKRQERDSKRD